MSASVQRRVAELRGRLQASQPQARHRQVVPTGLPSFDRLLPDGGVPTAAVVEWMQSCTGVAASTLAFRCAAPLLQHAGTLAVVDSEKDFYPPSLSSLGIASRRVLVVRPSPVPQNGGLPEAAQRRANVLWTIEQLARCEGVRVLVASIDRVSATAQRRLQLAVERSGVTVFLMRPARAAQQTSWADLRFFVQPSMATTSNRQSVLTVRLLRSKNSVRQFGQTELVCRYETGVVSEVSQLAGPANSAKPDS